MRLLVVVICLVLASCGGGSSTPAPTPIPQNPNTITITATGATPKELRVAPGTRVSFVNNDTRPHNMTSDPHPDHNECPEVNAVGFLNTGQSRETGNLIAVRTCGFHDHDDPTNTGLLGRIVIQ